MSDRCSSFTQKGTQCTKKRFSGGGIYCGIHKKNPITEVKQEEKVEPTQCSGTTKKGYRCSKRSLMNEKYCSLHIRNKNYSSNEPRETCASYTNRGTRCHIPKVTGSIYCSIHKDNPIPEPKYKEYTFDEYFNDFRNYFDKEFSKARPNFYKCCYYSCWNNVHGPSDFCYLHKNNTKFNDTKSYETKSSNNIDVFKNYSLDSKFRLLTIDKQQNLISAMKNYKIDPPSIKLEEVKKIYRKLAMENHPDKGGDAEKFKKILSDKELMENFLK